MPGRGRRRRGDHDARWSRPGPLPRGAREATPVAARDDRRRARAGRAGDRGPSARAVPHLCERPGHPPAPGRPGPALPLRCPRGVQPDVGGADPPCEGRGPGRRARHGGNGRERRSPPRGDRERLHHLPRPDRGGVPPRHPRAPDGMARGVLDVRVPGADVRPAAAQVQPRHPRRPARGRAANGHRPRPGVSGRPVEAPALHRPGGDGRGNPAGIGPTAASPS